MTTTPVLQTKQSTAWTTEAGEHVSAAPLYRYVADDDDSGVWYAKLDNAARSWNRRHPERQVTA